MTRRERLLELSLWGLALLLVVTRLAGCGTRQTATATAPVIHTSPALPGETIE